MCLYNRVMKGPQKVRKRTLTTLNTYSQTQILAIIETRQFGDLNPLKLLLLMSLWSTS